MQSGTTAIRRTLYTAIALVMILIIVGLVQTLDTHELDPMEMGVEIGEEHDWLLFDFAADADRAVGAIVAVEIEDEVLHGEVTAQNPRLFFDLGEVEAVDDVVITWADGRTQNYNNIPLNDRYKIVYPDSAGTALQQWVRMYGPAFQLGIYVFFGLLLVLFGVRVLSWAENRPEPVVVETPAHHTEHAEVTAH